jgi:hypothetical protein
MTMLAAVRPDDWNLPLLVHVAGAMLLVGALVVATVAMAGALRRGDGAAVLSRLGFRVLALGVLPAFVVMRVGAEWVASKEDVGEPDWIAVGYDTADGGLVLIIVATVLAWRVTRRAPDRPGVAGRAVLILSVALLVAFTTAIWAMTTKPG